METRVACAASLRKVSHMCIHQNGKGRLSYAVSYNITKQFINEINHKSSSLDCWIIVLDNSHWISGHF